MRLIDRIRRLFRRKQMYHFDSREEIQSAYKPMLQIDYSNFDTNNPTDAQLERLISFGITISFVGFGASIDDLQLSKMARELLNLRGYVRRMGGEHTK